jgi:hypothetical protein
MYLSRGNQLLGRQPWVDTMPEISISEEQHERLEQVRREVENAYVENYGYIPIEDALQYLLDTYTPPEKRDAVDDYERLATAEYPQLQAVASEVPDVPGSGIDADEMRGRLLAELGVDAFAAELGAAGAEPGGQPASGPGDESAADSAQASTGGDSSDRAGAGGEDELEETGVPGGSSGDQSSRRLSVGGGSSGGAADDSDEEGTTEGLSGETGVSTDTSGGSDPLAAVNRMLDEHDDRWRESGGDEPYEVDLPDGRTESVRTKDDVRQLLYRHY